eukprot:3965277-Amphidinium_carterae.1
MEYPLQNPDWALCDLSFISKDETCQSEANFKMSLRVRVHPLHPDIAAPIQVSSIQCYSGRTG